MNAEACAGRSVRPATLADAADAVDVLRSAITVSCVEDHRNDAATLEHWLRNKTVRQFEQWLLEPANFVAVSQAGTAVCGVGLIDRTGNLRLCYVRPEQHRLGVGRAILNALEDQALLWGLTETRLTSSATARAFYEKQGYSPDGESVPSFGVLRGYPYHKNLLEFAVAFSKSRYT